MKHHGRHKRIREATAPDSTAGLAGHHAWRFEYDSKVYCEHCRNYRGPQHTAEHRRIVAEGGSWPKRRIAVNYWP